MGVDTKEPEAGTDTPLRRQMPTDAVAVFPSAALRPVPSFTIGIPAGWVLDEAPDVLGVIRVPEPVDGFWVNLVVSTDRIDHRVKLAHAASITLDRLRRHCPDAVVTADRVADVAGRLVSIRAIEMTAPTSRRGLTLVQGLTVAPRAEGAKTRDLFQLTGSCPKADADRFGPIFVDTIASFRLT